MERASTRAVRWFRSRSAISGHVKTPTDPKFAGYFYCGPTRHFGHSPSKKGKR